MPPQKRYKSKRSYSWSAAIAYIVGLLTADGCLVRDGRHIEFTSKDLQLATLYRDLIRPGCLIGTKRAGWDRPEVYYRVQIGDVALYDFLLEAGLMPNKSKILESLLVPDRYFADFLRGLFDGDGSVYGFVDTRWKSSYMYCTTFASASPIFLKWLQLTVRRLTPVTRGSIRQSTRAQALSYAKRDSQLLFAFMYYNKYVPCLQRKYDRYLEVFAQDPHADASYVG